MGTVSSPPGWVPAFPAQTGQNFNFGITALTQTTKYRRWATSGCNSVDPTPPVTIFVQEPPSAGTIAASQTICNGTTPADLTCTPGIGTGTITYNWEQSVSPFSSWIPAVPTQLPNACEFAFGATTLTQTTHYRRITVSTAGANACNSVPTNVVTIIVQPIVTAGSIGVDQTICHGTTPANLTGTPGTGSGTITYIWEQSVSPFAIWSPAIPTQFGAGFAFGPTLLAQTTHYRRTTVSTVGGVPGVACNSVVTNTVIITVQDVPTAGTIAANQTICSGNNPSSICGTVPATGSGNLSYVWEVNTGFGWSVIVGETGNCYSPGALTDPTSYRRYTQSVLGLDTCNSDYTNIVTMTITDAPIAGVDGPTPLCQGTCETYTATGGQTGDTFQWSISGIYTSISYFENTVTICWGQCTEGWVQVTISRGNCSSTSAPFHVILLAPPAPVITGPLTVINNTNPSLAAIYEVLPSIPGHMFNWSVLNGTIIGGLGTSSISVLWNAPCLGCTGQVCVTELDPVTGCSGSSCITIYILPNGANVYGYVVYENGYNTGLDGVNLTLRNAADNSIAGTCVSAPNMLLNGETGYFAFFGIPFGTYILSAESDATWGGNNATDALIVQLLTPGPLSTPVKTLAADVNGSLTINATDALNIKLRVVGIVNFYAAGDWAFSPATPAPFTLDGSNLVQDFGNTFHGLCRGDVNGSFIPTGNGGMKSVPSLTATEDGIQTVAVGESFTYDLRSSSIADLGAMTLFMNYDQNLFEIENVKTSLEGLQYKVENGKLALAWSDVTPISVSNGEPIISLTVKAKDQISAPTQIFTINAGSEFANSNADPLNFNLKLSNVITGAKTFSLANYPNPFTNTTNIIYTLPEAGQVRLVITDMFGKTLSVLVDAMQDAGNYSVVVNPAIVNLTQGMYLYKIEVSGATDTYSKVNKLIFNK
jgi:hypothetical protein